MTKTVIVLPVLVAVITVINVCSANQPHYCRLPPVTGVCRAHMQRFYYNSRRGRCESFVYGGCRGNANRFITERACTAACGRPSVCSLPKVVGRCRAAIPRYYFNHRSGRCERFTYGGCHGNANNFRSLRRCQRQCPSSYSRGRRAATPHLTPQECRQPPQSGPCEAYIPSFYFNLSTNSCQSFVYGGCQGNTNRFPNEEQCMRACGSTGVGASIIGGGLQSSNPYSGLGNNQPTRGYPQGSIWPTSLVPFFQSLAKHLFSLQTSSSQKDGQKFLPEVSPVLSHRNTTNTPETSQASGNKSLGASVTPTSPTLVIDFPFGKHVCQQPKDPGFCYAAFTMFFYNKTADTCEPFIYGGCQGNGNRFESKEWCEMTCKTTTTPTFDTNDCLLPPKTGRCRAYFKRFYFNAASGRCEEFVYGGCQGNNNRFETLRECSGKCSGVRRTA